MTVARRLTLCAVDDSWADHLAMVTEIRDGIHLVRLAGRSPINEFIKEAAASFEEALNSIDDRMVREFLALDITSEGVDLAQAPGYGVADASCLPGTAGRGLRVSFNQVAPVSECRGPRTSYFLGPPGILSSPS